MIPSLLRLLGAATLFFGVHSLLAGNPAKRAARGLFGERRFRAFYRLAYSLLAFASFGALGAYAARLPDRDLYRARGPGAGLLRALQLVSMLQFLGAMRRFGFGRLLGGDGVAAWRRGDGSLLEVSQAQGPGEDGAGGLDTGGPFAQSRHPLEFWIMLVFWFHPRLSARLLAFNLLLTAYTVPACRHEEARLLERYGEDYAEYRRRVPHFLIPRALVPPFLRP